MKKTVLMSAAKKARIALAVMAVCGFTLAGAQSAFAECNVQLGTNIVCGGTVKDGSAMCVTIGGTLDHSYAGVAIGLMATTSGQSSNAYGAFSKATASMSVALGNESFADEENTVSVGRKETTITNDPYYGTYTYPTLYRRIVNMADGVNDHDAATVGQVKSMIAAGGAGSITTEKFNEMLNNNDAFNSLKNNMNGKADVDGGNIDKSQWADKLGTGKVEDGNKDLVTGDTVFDKIGDMTTLATDNKANLVGAVNEVNNKANANEKNIGDLTKLTTTEKGNLVGAVNEVNNKANANEKNIGDLTKLNTTEKGNLVGAVNEVNKKAAEAIKTVNGRVDELGGRVDTLGGAVAKLDSRVNKVGAGAAALAALHPMEFDSDNKLSFAAGVGNYRGTNAAAIGAFYRPSEQVMFSIAGNMGNGENMVNAGVSFALDRPSKTPTTKAALVKTVVAQNEQIAALNETLAEQNEKIARLEAMVEKLAAKQNA